MLVELKDGSCHNCGGQLQIIDADDDTLTVECTVCGQEDVVETDAFKDGCTHYWPEMMVRKMEEGEA